MEGWADEPPLPACLCHGVWRVRHELGWAEDALSKTDRAAAPIPPRCVTRQYSLDTERNGWEYLCCLLGQSDFRPPMAALNF